MGDDLSGGGGVDPSAAAFCSLGICGFSSMATSSFLMPDTDFRLFAISALTRAVDSVKLLASKVGLGKLMDPGTFSLFLFLPASLCAECGESMTCLPGMAFLLASSVDG